MKEGLSSFAGKFTHGSADQGIYSIQLGTGGEGELEILYEHGFSVEI